MKFRGLDPRTRIARWGLVAVGVGMVLGATGPAAAAGLIHVLEVNRDNLPWILERLFAFLAYFALAASVAYGLLLSTKILDAIAHRPITFALHQDLASFGLGLAGIHGALLGLDKTIPFSVAQMTVPGLAPYATIGVAFGQVAFYISLVVVGSFYVRKHIGQRAWRIIHYLTFLAFFGATAHGLAAGTDSGSAWAWWIYVGSATLVAFLFAYRVTLAIGRRGRATATDRAATLLFDRALPG